jgi:hypothetical protein
MKAAITVWVLLACTPVLCTLLLYDMKPNVALGRGTGSNFRMAKG